MHQLITTIVITHDKHILNQFIYYNTDWPYICTQCIYSNQRCKFSSNRENILFHTNAVSLLKYERQFVTKQEAPARPTQWYYPDSSALAVCHTSNSRIFATCAVTNAWQYACNSVRMPRICGELWRVRKLHWHPRRMNEQTNEQFQMNEQFQTQIQGCQMLATRWQEILVGTNVAFLMKARPTCHTRQLDDRAGDSCSQVPTSTRTRITPGVCNTLKWRPLCGA